MAEIKLTDLPVITEEEFTPNDRFLILDDGKSRTITQSVLASWITHNLSGVQGEQGVAGKDGINGKDGVNGTNGKDGLSAYQIAVTNGFIGTQKQWVESLGGIKGDTGDTGNNGWSPILKTVPRGADELVLQLTDWIGGTGVKPSTTGYISETGVVTNIASATNIKGSKGLKGDTGAKGDAGTAGADGKDGAAITAMQINPSGSITVNNADGTSLTSNTPLPSYGWATYKDSQYTNTTTLSIPVNTEEVIPNNKSEIIENLPNGVTTFYDNVTQKYLMKDPKGFYSVRVRFKVAASAEAGNINLSMSKATTDIPYSEDKTLRGDNKIQDMSFSTFIYGDAALAANGLTIRIKTFDRAVNIYNIETTIAKLI